MVFRGVANGTDQAFGDVLELHFIACYNAGTTTKESTFLTNQEQRELIKQGVAVWNSWRARNHLPSA